jgi:hypothetical protein
MSASRPSVDSSPPWMMSLVTARSTS